MGRKRHPVAPSPANTGGDAARFAAANLPPYKAQSGTGHAVRDDERSSVDPELLAARAAAAQYDALYDSRPQPARRRSTMVVLALVFAVGAGAGLAGAKWFASTPKRPSFAMPPLAMNPPVATTVDPDGQARPLRGIRPSELPYDGRTSEQDDEAMPDEVKATDSQDSNRQPVKTPSGQDANAAPAPQQSKAATGEQAQVRDSRRTPAESHGAPPPSKQSKRTEAPPRKATQTAKSGKGKENDKEIERMRRQADEELTKKTAAASRDVQRKNSEPSRLQQVSAALASCDRRSNIILRESCRWQVCNGMWGKNGCPSYASARRDPYAY